MSNKTTSYLIKILNKAFAVLEILLKDKTPLGMTEISKKLAFYPSTVHRILDTLKYRDYVKKDPTSQGYQLELKLLELGMTKLKQINLVKGTTPCRLTERTITNKNKKKGVIAAVSI